MYPVKLCQVYYLYHFISSLGTKLDLLWHTKLYSATSFPKLYFSILSIFIANTYIYVFFNIIQVWFYKSKQYLAEAATVKPFLSWADSGPQFDRGQEKEFYLFILNTWLEAFELPQLETDSDPELFCLPPLFHLSSAFSYCYLLLTQTWSLPWKASL